jgi:hypothetical protein
LDSKKIILFSSIALLLLSYGRPAEVVAERVEEPVRQSIDIRQKTQEEEEMWQHEKEKLNAQFEQLLQDKKYLQQQKLDLQQELATTWKRISSKEKQLRDIEQISEQIRPFLDTLVTELKMEINNSLPFLMTERTLRLEKLESLLTIPEVSISEKYRKVMEALLVEAEYGFTIEARQETIEITGNKRLVNIFRLGRLSLFYQSLDRKECGFYNIAENLWQPLKAKYNHDIHNALAIAAKQQPAEIISLPLGRMVNR